MSYTIQDCSVDNFVTYMCKLYIHQHNYCSHQNMLSNLLSPFLWCMPLFSCVVCIRVATLKTGPVWRYPAWYGDKGSITKQTKKTQKTCSPVNTTINQKMVRMGVNVKKIINEAKRHWKATKVKPKMTTGWSHHGGQIKKMVNKCMWIHHHKQYVADCERSGCLDNWCKKQTSLHILSYFFMNHQGNLR